ncbi:MAG: glycosyltransferase family 4 protein [Lachnospiraceae bacterium]|nr:glycosyltransferase family 4 protein [Lachnospiraceae bacterium]
MRILIDNQILMLQEYGGVSRYFFQISKRLNKQEDAEVCIPAVYSCNAYFDDPGYLRRKYSRNFLTQLWYCGVNLFVTAVFLLRHDIQIYHPTFFRPYLFGFLKKRTKVVVTVHDMIFELFPGELPGADKVIRWKKACIERADHIIAVSEWTKRDLLRFYPEIPEERISVIHHGPPEEGKCRPLKGIPDRYVLFVGKRAAYKNFSVLCEAMNLLMKEDPALHLVCAGGGVFSESETAMMEYGGRFFQSDCSDEELSYAYQHAACFVFPSRYEGFGLPVLEAFVNKCPVILSETGCFPEIAGDAALYFDPDSSEDLADKIRKMLSPEVARMYIERGLSRVKAFSWDKACEATHAVYASLVGQGQMEQAYGLR